MRNIFLSLVLLFAGSACQITAPDIKPISACYAQTYRPLLSTVNPCVSTANTTCDGKQVYIVMGDSKNAISDDTDQASPSPTTGTAFQFDHTTNTVIALTSTDLVNAGTGGTKRGSPWPQFCITYNSLTGKKAVIVDGHEYGSYWSNASVGLSWDTNGTLYERMRDRAYRALSILGLRKPIGINIILGINDNGSATTLATVQANMQAIINRLATDFGSDVPVYVTMMGTDNNSPTTRTGGLRSSLRDLSINNAQVHETVNENQLFSLGIMATDLIHWKQAANNQVGKWIAQYVANIDNDTDKNARQWINSYLYDAVNTTKKNGIRTFITDEKASGNWPYDFLQIYVGDTENNILLDISGRTSPLKPTNAYTFSANNYISTDGATTYLRTFYSPGLIAKYASQNDIVMGFGCKTMTTTAGTAATAMGTAAGGVAAISQDASSRTNFQINNATPQTYTTDTKLQSNTDYMVWRTTSTNLELLKNGSIVSTKSVASNAFSSGFWNIGCKNNSNPDTPTSGSFYNGQFTYSFSDQATTFSASSFVTHINTLVTILAVP